MPKAEEQNVSIVAGMTEEPARWYIPYSTGGKRVYQGRQ